MVASVPHNVKIPFIENRRKLPVLLPSPLAKPLLKSSVAQPCCLAYYVKPHVHAPRIWRWEWELGAESMAGHEAEHEAWE